MLANFFVLWLLLAVGGGFLLFFGGLLASWIGEEMVCFLLATALLALAGGADHTAAGAGSSRPGAGWKRRQTGSAGWRRSWTSCWSGERIIRRKVLTPPEKKVEEQTLCPSKNRE